MIRINDKKFYVIGCLNLTLKSLMPCTRCNYYKGECTHPSPAKEGEQIVIKGRWEILRFEIPKEEILLETIHTHDFMDCLICQHFENRPDCALCVIDAPEFEDMHKRAIDYCDSFKKIPNKWEALKLWLISRLEQVDLGRSVCDIGSDEEAHFLKATSRYNEVLNRMKEIEVADPQKNLPERQKNMPNEEKKYLCEICGSDHNVKYRCGGSVAFLCVKCERIISRWNRVQAIFSKRWSGATEHDILEMREYAEYNNKIKSKNIDNSMSVLVDEKENDQ